VVVVRMSGLKCATFGTERRRSGLNLITGFQALSKPCGFPEGESVAERHRSSCPGFACTFSPHQFTKSKQAGEANKGRRLV
jgi:hypothetical protein